jgi:hypothetical protein
MKPNRSAVTRRPLLLALFASALLLAPAPPALAGPPIAVASWSPLQWAMGTQKRMLQVGTVGMCLAIYIIMWRK